MNKETPRLKFKPLSDIHMVFGSSGDVVDREEIPKIFFNSNKWSDFAQQVFFQGFDGSEYGFIPFEGTDAKMSFRAFRCMLGGFDFKHEEKIAAAGWLLWSAYAVVFARKPVSIICRHDDVDVEDTMKMLTEREINLDH